jgi:hypothetical protein
VTYLGHLSRRDPLYGYLRHEVLPQLGLHGAAPDFRVHRLRASNQVYLYKDRYSGIRLIGKFFGGVAGRSAETASRRMRAEYNNLVYLRSIGLAGYPHYVARPLGCNDGLNCVLIEEFCEGRPLADFILDAIRHGAGCSSKSRRSPGFLQRCITGRLTQPRTLSPVAYLTASRRS